MKKLITTSFALLCALSSAQINLTPDSNFGNNGTVNLAPNLTKFLSFHFLNDKIMVQNIDYSNPDLLGSRITMLSGNGNLDTSFGANGSFFLDSSSDFVHYIDGNQLLFFSGKKYLHNGTLDATYGNNGQSQTFSDELYRKVLSNGKLLVRTENNFYQFDQSGNLDLTFGNNGIVNAYNSNFSGSLIPDFKTNTSFFSLNNNYVLEHNFNNSLLRKADFAIGNYDASYGISGNGQYFNSTSAGIMKFQPLNDGSVVNYLFDYNVNSKYLTKTLSTGLLDNNFGTNGKIDLPENINGNSLLYNQDFAVYNQSHYIVPVLDQNFPKKIYLCSFNTSGLSTINSQSLLDTGITTEMLNPDDKIFVSVKDNYLYLFVAPNLIKRYLISESVLSANENSLKEIYNFNNPFQDELKISTNENIKSTEFYDNSGRLVLKNMGSKNINTSSLERGVYIIVVTSSNNKILSKKVIKN